MFVCVRVCVRERKMTERTLVEEWEMNLLRDKSNLCALIINHLRRKSHITNQRQQFLIRIVDVYRSSRNAGKCENQFRYLIATWSRWNLRRNDHMYILLVISWRSPTVSISRYHCILLLLLLSLSLLLLLLLLSLLLLIIIIYYYYYYCYHYHHPINDCIENVKMNHRRKRNFGTLRRICEKKKVKKEYEKKATQGPTVIVDLRESSDSINLYHNWSKVLYIFVYYMHDKIQWQCCIERLRIRNTFYGSLPRLCICMYARNSLSFSLSL